MSTLINLLPLIISYVAFTIIISKFGLVNKLENTILTKMPSWLFWSLGLVFVVMLTVLIQEMAVAYFPEKLSYVSVLANIISGFVLSLITLINMQKKK